MGGAEKALPNRRDADGHVRPVVIASDNDSKLAEYLYIGIDSTYNSVYK